MSWLVQRNVGRCNQDIRACGAGGVVRDLGQQGVELGLPLRLVLHDHVEQPAQFAPR